MFDVYKIALGKGGGAEQAEAMQVSVKTFNLLLRGNEFELVIFPIQNMTSCDKMEKGKPHSTVC